MLSLIRIPTDYDRLLWPTLRRLGVNAIRPEFGRSGLPCRSPPQTANEPKRSIKGGINCPNVLWHFNSSQLRLREKIKPTPVFLVVLGSMCDKSAIAPLQCGL